MTSNVAPSTGKDLKIQFFRAAVFLSSFLFFVLQPMSAKTLLPHFGGSFMVWGTCLVFFQGFLLAGYLTAHGGQIRFGVSRFSRIHWLLLLGSLLVIPIGLAPLAHWEMQASPAVHVTAALTFALGLPVLTLALNSVLLQRWLSVSNSPHKNHPYALYSASNLGSLSALLLYPILIEASLTLRQQFRLWWIGYVLLLGLMYVCMPERSSKNQAGKDIQDQRPIPVPGVTYLIWFVCAASGSALLIATTNVITLDIASIPLLWTVPLALYLFTFVLVFKRRPWFPAFLEQNMIWGIVVGMMLFLMSLLRVGFPAPLSIGLHLFVLFSLCLCCHGWLVKNKPENVRNLSLFYVVLAAGGFAGTFLITFILPRANDSMVDLPVGLCLVSIARTLISGKPARIGTGRLAPAVAAAGIALLILPALAGGRQHLSDAILYLGSSLFLLPAILSLKQRPHLLSVLLIVILVMQQWTEQLATGGQNMWTHRNYYGIYKIYEENGIRNLQHSTTLHGRQYLDPERAKVPLSYHHPKAPAGEVIRSGLIDARSIGMIGLGTGACTLYGRDGEDFVVYELDPDNKAIAESHFTYLGLARARGVDVDVVPGDARVSLRSEPDDRFDLFIIDAFSSASIPIHLLTLNACREYQRVITNEGLILFHLSSRYLNLSPVLFRLARETGLQAIVKPYLVDTHPDADPCIWLAMSADSNLIAAMRDSLGWRRSSYREEELPRLWTDQFSTVLELLGGL